MQLIDILIYIMMFYYGLQGYAQGALGRKFYFEKNFLSIALSPVFMPLIRPLIEQHTNFVLGFLISWIISYALMMSIIIFVYARSIRSLDNPQGRPDKYFGCFLGFIKGFLMAGVITFITGVVFADKFMPNDVANQLKVSHAGITFSKPINFYRFFIFGVSEVEVDASIGYKPSEFYKKIKKEYNDKHKW